MRSFSALLFAVGFISLLAAGNVFCGQVESKLPEDRVITLKEAVELALQNNRSIKQSELNVTSSRISVEATEYEFDIKVRPATAISFTSEDDRWIGGVELAKKNRPGITTSVTPTIQRSGDEYKSSVEAVLSVPLLNGFGTDYNLDRLYSSIYDLENAQRSYYQQQVNIVLDTISTVYQVIKNQQQVNLLTSQIDALENHILLTNIKEKTGLATAMDLYRAEIRQKEVQNELTSVNEQLKKSTDPDLDFVQNSKPEIFPESFVTRVRI